MIEVFKTDVNLPEKADQIIFHLNTIYPEYIINFDLDDCDRILRVKSGSETIDTNKIIEQLNFYNHKAEVLTDEINTQL